MKKAPLVCASLLVSFLIVSGCYTTYESWALQHGANQWRDGNYKDAIRYFEDVLKNHPQDADAYMWLALTWEDLGDYEKAKEYFSKAVELDPRYSFVFYDIGSNKVESADIRRGWRAIDSASNRSGYKKIGYDQAITSFNLALKKNPRSAEAYRGLGTIWADKGNYDQAIEFLSKAIEVESKAKYFWLRAVVWRKEKNFDRALEDYNKVLELIPADDRSPYAVRARKLALEAISDLQKKLNKK